MALQACAERDVPVLLRDRFHLIYAHIEEECETPLIRRDRAETRRLPRRDGVGGECEFR